MFKSFVYGGVTAATVTAVIGTQVHLNSRRLKKEIHAIQEHVPGSHAAASYYHRSEDSVAYKKEHEYYAAFREAWNGKVHQARDKVIDVFFKKPANGAEMDSNGSEQSSELNESEQSVMDSVFGQVSSMIDGANDAAQALVTKVKGEDREPLKPIEEVTVQDKYDDPRSDGFKGEDVIKEEFMDPEEEEKNTPGDKI